MTYRSHQTNKKTGVTYVYDVVFVWHKELGQARNKQICVGKLDPVTGELVTSKRLNPSMVRSGTPPSKHRRRSSAHRWCWMSFPSERDWRKC